MKLKDIAEKIDYGLTEKAKNEKVGPKFLRITDIQNNRVDWDTVPYCECDEKEFKKNKLESGDIVFARTGATTGKSFLIDELDDDAVYASYLIRLRLTQDKVLPEFVSYFFKSAVYWRQIYADSDGATLPSFNAAKLKKLEIPLPSLSEQKAIVAKLDRAQRLIDIDREMLAKYDELIQSVFLEMFGCVFTDKSESPFEQHLDIIHGYAFKSKWFDDEGDVPIVKIGTVNKSTVDFSEIQFLDLSYAEEYERFKVYPGDLLLSMTDDYDFYLLNQRVVKLNYDKMVFTKSFLYHFFKQDYIKHELTKFSRGIRQANLSNKDIYGLSFQKPVFKKQLQFESLCEKVEQEKKTLQESTKKSQELFSSLVQGVFG